MRILIAEDEPVSRRRLELLLGRWGYEVVSVGDGEAAWRKLSIGDPPRLAILDWMMPGLDGVSLCRKVRASRDEPYTYILLLTVRDKEANLIEAMEAGADDFLAKPFKPQELESRLRAGRRICQLQEDLIQAREALREQATKDVLTDCWNRRAVLETLDRELRRSVRSPRGSGLGLLVADLDHFKRINDSYGHPVGDQVLRETVERISSQIRPYDAVGRLGGEEFLVLLTDCRHEQIVKAAERLRTVISDRPFETSAGEIAVTVSIGAVSLAPGTMMPAELALSTADRALYHAKDAGRNRCCCVQLFPDGTAPALDAMTATHGREGHGRRGLRARTPPSSTPGGTLPACGSTSSRA